MWNILTIDVEEYFHPAEVCPFVRRRDWHLLSSRVTDQTTAILDLLDRHKAKATFFILGWVAHRQPKLVREIVARGHEIGCHSYTHRLVYELSPAEFREDTSSAVNAIADAAGVRPMLYRAPSYSITKQSLWALEILVQSGFTHDSSIYPISHDRYGIPGFQRHMHTLHTPSGPICEVPVATALVLKSAAPVGGGGYLRLLPYRYTAAGIRRINTEGQPACIYFHPWEIDPAQPRIVNGFVARARTYTGLRSMMTKLSRLLLDFRFAPMTQVHPKLCVS
jgi:polysaccharide deacetylase family protein (PEP-CTERM system associated)